MTQQTYSHDVVFSALCIMEELLNSVLGEDAPHPWSSYWEQNGVNEMRELTLELAPHADAAWQVAYACFEAQCKQPGVDMSDPGSFDYDFIPVWLRHCVDWDADRPCVRNPQILADKLAAEAEAVRSSDDLPVAITLERPGAGEIEMIGRFATVEEAENFLGESATIDPDLLVAGNYGIDAPEEMVNPGVAVGVLACPQCKDTDHLYDRADVRYDPDSRDWVVGDREGTIECTECDWSGQESELDLIPDPAIIIG